MKKAQRMAVHMERNKKDAHNKRNMVMLEAKIHKLSRYYKNNGVLQKNWKYEPKIASIA
jgi:small subunit ribosomal protein S15